MPDIIETLRDTYALNPAAALNMLPELFKQYDEGLIKVLPCKAGDTVYKIIAGKIHQRTVKGFIQIYNGEWFATLNRGNSVSFKSFGETVFLTREEAEKALNPEAGITATEQRSVKSNEQS